MTSAITRGTLLGLAIGIALLGCSSAQSTTAGSRAVGNVGEVGLSLSLPDGIKIDQLDWTIRDSAGSDVLDSQHDSPGPILLPVGTSSIAFEVGSIPAGTGYTITLGGTDSNSDPCSGVSAAFDVVAGATSSATVNVVCWADAGVQVLGADAGTGNVIIQGGVTVETLDGGTVVCPGIAGVSAGPLNTLVGGPPVNFNTSVVGPAASYAWTQSPAIGTFSDATAANPSFTCDQAGSATITLTVSASGSSVCAAELNTTALMTVTCSPGLDASESDSEVDGCVSSSTTCNSNCLDTCGNTCTGGDCCVANGTCGGRAWNITIQTVNGYYLTAVNGGGVGGPPSGNCPAVIYTNVSTPEPGPWETFTCIALGANQVAFQTATGDYMTAVGGGGIGGPNADPYEIHTDVSPTRWLGPWEQFQIVWLSGEECALKTDNGDWVTAVSGGGCGEPGDSYAIRTNATSIGPDETFTINY